MDRMKVDPEIRVTVSPDGYRWEVLVGGQAISSGSATTEPDARAAAKEIADRASQQPFEGP
jgi:hypothetical protein